MNIPEAKELSVFAVIFVVSAVKFEVVVEFVPVGCKVVVVVVLVVDIELSVFQFQNSKLNSNIAIGAPKMETHMPGY